MSKLGQVVESLEKYNKYVLDQVKRARTDQKFGRDLLGRWNDTKAKIPVTRTPTGLPLPRLALPEIDEAGEIARYIFGEGLPGEFPYLNATYREMYLEPVRETESFEKNGNKSGKKIICGHTPSRDGEIQDAGYATCIDTGAVLGRWLTCLDAESGHYWQASQKGVTRASQIPNWNTKK
jgi:hypothetical protein